MGQLFGDENHAGSYLQQDLAGGALRRVVINGNYSRQPARA